MKNVLSIHRQGEGHWVGDGFPVHTVFHYQERPELSPFLLLDHAGPSDFAPSDKARGVGWHPHRGFETVTVVLDGEVDQVLIEATSDARLFVMNGEPIDEPVAGHGPFVMNTPREIQQAFADLQHGRLGKIPELTR